MRIGIRMVAVMASLLMLATGPLAPLAAAQQPAPQQPAPRQPDLMQEAIKASERDTDSDAYDVGAGIANVFYVPGKVGLCALGGAVAFSLLILTIGSGYKAAANVAREGCGGKWTLTGEDLKTEPDVKELDLEKARKY